VRDGEAVGAEQHEAGLTHVDEAGQTEVDVEADGGERVCGRGRGEELASVEYVRNP
jgi:hypothetical protein